MAKKSQKETAASNKLDVAAALAQEKIEAAAENAQNMIDAAASKATDALVAERYRGRPIIEHGPVIEAIDANITRDHDELIIVKESVKDLAAEVERINNKACTVDAEYTKDHDLLNTLIAEFDTVRDNLKVIIGQVGTLQLTLGTLQSSLAQSISVTPRLDALEKEAATANAEARTNVAEAQSFMASHINTILSLLVVGLVGTVLTIMWYAIH